MKNLVPIVKWPGGKTSELRKINEYLPYDFNRYFEPFLGGGAVYFSLEHKSGRKYYLNDISNELINLYKLVSNQDTVFLSSLNELRENWLSLERTVELIGDEFIEVYFKYRLDHYSIHRVDNKFEEMLYKYSEYLQDLFVDKFNPDIEKFKRTLIKSLNRKFRRMKQLENELGNMDEKDYIKNIETAFKSAFYTHVRYLYNNVKILDISENRSIAFFYFIREYCYSSMFRYNLKGEFNVPYGGMAYNRKDFTKKINYLTNESLINRMRHSKFFCNDFEEFYRKFNFKSDDFIFLDPPYDTDFSDYAKNSFGREDQIRLAEFIYKTKAKVMLVIKRTDFILSLYEKKGLNIYDFDKKYMVNFQSRNDRRVNHLVITNYNLEG